MNHVLKLPTLVLAACTLWTASAGAQSIGPGFGKQKHKSGYAVHVELGVPVARYGYYAPPPAPPPRWEPGHYATVTRHVWVPGATRREWCPPVHQKRYDACGRPILVLVRPAQWITVSEPGHYELRSEQVWVAGRWCR